MLRSLYRLGFEWEALEYFAFVIEAVSRRVSGGHHPADHVRDRRTQGPDRADARPPLGLEGFAAGAGGQRCVGPAPERRVGDDPRRRRHPPDARERRRSSNRCGRGSPGSSTPPSPTPATRTRASGRSAATRSTSPPPRSCAGWPWTGAPTWPGPGATTERAEQWRKGRRRPQGRDPRPGGRRTAASASTTATRSSTRRSSCIPILGFLPPEDERVRATVLAIADELTEDGLVLRYKVDSTDTGFEGKEGTFTICSFWLVTALAMIGERDRARALCTKLLNFAGPLQLYAEEIDATTGEHLGNFPQAFTHLALIDAVGRLIEAESSDSPGRVALQVHGSTGADPRVWSRAYPHPPVSHDAGSSDPRRLTPWRGPVSAHRYERSQVNAAQRHRVVVVGGGFGGLPATRLLSALRHHADRPAQPPPLPAASLPGRHGHPLTGPDLPCPAPYVAQKRTCGSSSPP